MRTRYEMNKLRDAAASVGSRAGAAGGSAAGGGDSGSDEDPEVRTGFIAKLFFIHLRIHFSSCTGGVALFCPLLHSSASASAPLDGRRFIPSEIPCGLSCGLSWMHAAHFLPRNVR